MLNWTKTKKGLYRKFKFSSFTSCIEFLSEMAPHCDAIQHHPDLVFINPSEIEVFLKTHDENRITEKDKNLALFIDKIRV